MEGLKVEQFEELRAIRQDENGVILSAVVVVGDGVTQQQTRVFFEPPAEGAEFIEAPDDQTIKEWCESRADLDAMRAKVAAGFVGQSARVYNPPKRAKDEGLREKEIEGFSFGYSEPVRQ